MRPRISISAGLSPRTAAIAPAAIAARHKRKHAANPDDRQGNCRRTPIYNPQCNPQRNPQSEPFPKRKNRRTMPFFACFLYKFNIKD